MPSNPTRRLMVGLVVGGLLVACSPSAPTAGTTTVTATVGSRTPDSRDTATRITEASDTPATAPTPPPAVPENMTTSPGSTYVTDGETTTAPVASITDGDTVRVLLDGQNVPVRIIGIDTPETKKPGTPVQCYGPEATAQAVRLLTGQTITLTTDPTQDDTDRYGRLLRYINLPDGTDYGQRMITAGYAHEYTYNHHFNREAAYIQAQQDAQQAGAGGWKECGW